jgi:SsrA-binding protein
MPVSKKGEKENKIIAQNRKARHDYFIEDSFEAGIMLQGSEVKSIREGNVNLTDAFAEQRNGDVYMMGAYIAEYKGATHFNHHTRRPRKLLLHKSEIQKLFGKLKVKGYTLVPLSLYLNEKNLVKVELGLAKGKKQHDKREALKERDWQRQKDRAMKE